MEFYCIVHTIIIVSEIFKTMVVYILSLRIAGVLDKAINTHKEQKRVIYKLVNFTVVIQTYIITKFNLEHVAS